jgi:cbb3-type cytochrome oxidase subunit 3
VILDAWLWLGLALLFLGVLLWLFRIGRERW